MTHRVVLLSLVLLAACARETIPVVEETSPSPLPAASYEAAAAGAQVYRVLPGKSLLLVHVGRDGAMKRLGHDHAIASESLQGWVELADDPNASRADLALSIRSLIVDKPAYRKRLGLDTEPTQSDIAGTYTNMLKVFQPALYPYVQVHARFASAQTQPPQLVVSVALHGTSFEYLLPVQMTVSEDELVVTGEATIRHADFAVAPFRAAGGLLRVADAMDVEFRIVAIASSNVP